MRISYRWLTEWVKTDLTAEAAAEQFTLSGVEVDSVEPVAPPLDGVVVGKIISLEPHPDADRLSVCRVEGDSAERTIVCGAPNARAGMKAPLAVLGTTLPGGMKIKPAKLRGVASEGMLCSEPELGLGEDASGLMELPEDAPVGARLDEYLGLDDHVLEIDLTPNRADCLSVRGLARELGAISQQAVVEPEIREYPAETSTRIDIDLEAPADCPRYVGRIVEGIDPTAATPLWMAEKLRRSGIRSLGPIVDATNYVLLELGQPMHAFDLACIDGGIRVRRARSGDRIKLLDGQEIEPDEDMLLIADHEKPLALGGIMGGLDSAVGEGTDRILLESAWFNPATISGRARRLGLSTESAHRYERGVDPGLQRLAIERATALIVEIAGGKPGPVIEALHEAHLPEVEPVTLRLDRLNALLGVELDAAEVESILERLGMAVAARDGVFEVRAPSARRDIEIEADLIEEVARIYGYDRLPSRHPGGELSVQVPGEKELEESRVRNQLAARGFQEILTWSFVGYDDLERLSLAEGAQPLANALSRDMAVLRTSLLAGLVDVAGRNLRRRRGSFRLFESGACFRNTPQGFSETWHYGLLMTGSERAEHFSGAPRELDFFDLKGEIEHLLAFNQIAGVARFERTDAPWLHPGQGARLLIDGEDAGWLGQLHPALVDAFELGQPVFVAELDAGRVGHRRLPSHRSTGRFPAIRRDLALVIDEKFEAAEIIDKIGELAGNLLENCVIFDQYRGEGIETGCRSLAIGLIFRDVSRTLKDSDVDSLIDGIVQGLGDRFNAKLRG